MLQSRASVVAAAVLMLASACVSTPAGPLVGSGVRNYHEVDEQLRRGAQPTADGVVKLSSLGIVTIINLRSRSSAPEAFDAEKATADVRMVHYETIPLSNWFAPREGDVERILQIINDPARQPIFVHCQRGADRTGTIVAIYRIMHDCKTADEAIREARQHGMGWWHFPMRRFIRTWYRSKQPQECKALARGAA